MLAPVLAVATLLVCVWLGGESLTGPWFLLAVMGFLTTAGVIDAVALNATNRPQWRVLVSVQLRWALIIAFLWVLLSISGFDTRFNLRLGAIWALTTPWVIWTGQWLLGLALGHASAVSGPVRPAIIVGLTEVGLRLQAELENNPLLHTRVLGFFEDRSLSSDLNRLPNVGRERVLGKPADAAAYIKSHGVQQVYITLPMTRHPRILALFESLRDTTASVYFVPDLQVFSLVQARFDAVGDVPVLALCETPFVGAGSLAKRLFDIVISGAMIVALSPVLLAVALGVKLTSRGPVLFRQQRYGLDGQEIWVYKFRSMTVTEDGRNEFAAARTNDVRVTPFGVLIRKTSLDELPQLFNTFLGSMSIVGPRPHVVAQNEQYRKLIPGYMIRHKVKPGITGWAQVNGARGGDDLEAMRRRIEYDLEYLRNWSLTLDLSILLRTIAVVLRDRNAY